MKPFIQSSAEDDILRQVEWYADKGLPDVARRFAAAVAAALDELSTMPAAGAPRHIRNVRLAGLRTWPVRGFARFRVYYLAHPQAVVVLRVLHDKRDIGTILDEQTVEDTGLP